MNASISQAEQLFIIHGVEQNIRNDGRTSESFRPMIVESGMVSNSSGSSRLRLGNTDVLVGVKVELESPQIGQPDEGQVKFFVDCSANATPEFEGRGGADLALDICSALTDAYHSSGADHWAVDRRALCIVRGRFCWSLCVDIVLLECGGNLYDAVSLAVKAALSNVRIPNVKVIKTENGEPDLDLTDDFFDSWRLDVSNVPLIVTVHKIGSGMVVDATMEEESCALSRLIMAVSPSKNIIFTRQEGRGSLDCESIIEMTKLSVSVAARTNDSLINTLRREEDTQPDPVGFL